MSPREARGRRLWSAALGVVIVGVILATVPSAVATPSPSDVMRSAIDDVQAFWAKKLPEVYGTEYEPIPQNRLYPYSESNPPPACGGSGTTPYKDVANNAFYCPAGDFLAWDAQGLIPTIQRQFGDFAVALVAAHEIGHAIQQRTRTSARVHDPSRAPGRLLRGRVGTARDDHDQRPVQPGRGRPRRGSEWLPVLPRPYGYRPHDGRRARVGVRPDLGLQRRLLGGRTTVQELRHSTTDRHRNPIHQQQ